MILQGKGSIVTDHQILEGIRHERNDKLRPSHILNESLKSKFQDL